MMIITTTGEQIIAEHLISGEALNLQYVAIGDGGGQVVIPIKEQTALVREVHRGIITTSSIATDDRKTISIIYTIPSDVGGWTVRECGILDDSENLIAVGSVNPIYKPSPEDGEIVNLTIRCLLTVSSELNVTLSTDPFFKAIHAEIVSVTTDIFNEHNIDPNAHPNILGLPFGGNDGDVLIKYGFTDKSAKWKLLKDSFTDENGNFFLA